MEKQENKKPELQPEVAEKYELVGVTPGTYQFAGFGQIDLTKIDVAEADALVKAEFPYLKVRERKAGANATPAKP